MIIKVRNPIETGYSIRKPARKDLMQLISLCAEHAEYEGSTYDFENKMTRLSNMLFSNERVLECLVVASGQEIYGYCTFMKQFSTWDTDWYVYMDCLYLKEEMRGKGLGKELINRVAQYARTQNCSQIQWQTPKSNTNAIEFYRNYGAYSKSKERFFFDLE